MALKVSLGSKKTVAIDWDAKDLRLVYFRPRPDGVDLIKAVSIPLAAGVNPAEAEPFGAFVREALRQAKVGAKQVLLDIPRDRIVLNTLSLPPTPAEEMPAMVKFQIGKELPFSTEQATLDFAVNGDFDPKAPCTMLVAAIRNEELDYFRRVASEAGLTIASLGLRPLANLTALRAGSPEGLKGLILFVEIGPQMTEINVIRDGSLAFSRAASVSLLDLPKVDGTPNQDSRISGMPVPDLAPDDASGALVREVLVEVSRSFDAYRATDPGAGVTRVVIAGAVGIEQEVAHGLSSRFGVRAELYSPERALNLPPQRARELRGFSAAIGSALNHNRKQISRIDFHNPKKHVSRRQLQLKKAPAAAIAAAILVVAGVGFHLRWVRPLNDEAEGLRGQVSALRKQANLVTDFRGKLTAIEEWQLSEQYWPEVLASLTEAFPPEEEAFAETVAFETKIATRRSNSRPSVFSVTLRMRDKDVIHKTLDRMKEAGFDNVAKKNITPSNVGEFKWTSPVAGDVPMRPKSSKSAEAPLPSPKSSTSAPMSVPTGVPVQPTNPSPNPVVIPKDMKLGSPASTMPTIGNGAAVPKTNEPATPARPTVMINGVPVNPPANGKPADIKPPVNNAAPPNVASQPNPTLAPNTKLSPAPAPTPGTIEMPVGIQPSGINPATSDEKKTEPKKVESPASDAPVSDSADAPVSDSDGGTPE